LENPPGVKSEDRRQQLDFLNKLGEISHHETGDPEVLSRMQQYEMAFRMQTSVPEIMDTAGEPDYIYEMYGEDSRTPGHRRSFGPHKNQPNKKDAGVHRRSALADLPGF